MPYCIPDEFKHHIAEVHGQPGISWTNGLPDLLDELARRWDIVIDPPFEPLSYNYVAPVVQAGGGEAVIKMSFPNPEFYSELAALDHFDDQSMVRLLDKDPDDCAMLLERVRPGNPLSQQQDDHYATQVVLEVIENLPLVTEFDYDFPTIHRWGHGFDRYLARFGFAPAPLPGDLVELARTQYAELVRTMGQLRLLHGDLHHGNILYSSTGEWKAIDPKGVIGEVSYEFGAFLRNPYPEIGFHPDLASILNRRVKQVTTYFDLPEQRIWRWAFSQAVLSAIWSLEDEGHGWESMIRFAEVCLGFL